MGDRVAAINSSRADLSSVKSWGYWLQGADTQTLVYCGYDLLVIDYSVDGSDGAAYSPEQIAKVRDSGKLVLAYLSIGEAEDYRFYWQQDWEPGNPGFVGPENPEWEGNYKVKYWMEGWWQEALRPYLDRIIAAGFYGVYLDIIDAYYYWGENGYDMEQSADRMVELVNRIAGYSRNQTVQGFIVCPQNGVSVIDAASSAYGASYLNVIDSVGVEDLFYNFWSQEDKAYRLNLLARFDAAGKKIFNVEYIAPALYDKYFALLGNQSLDIIGYAADPDRELDELLGPFGATLTRGTKWALWTDGPHLRGANIYQRRVYPELDGPTFMGPGPVGPPYIQKDLNRLASLGANYVNISHPGLFTESAPYVLDPDIRDNLDNLLNMVAQADMFAVISFRTGPGRSEFTFFCDEVGDWFDASYFNDSIWQDQAAQDAWAVMWRYTAERYRNNQIIVGYDLMVEPNSNEVGSHALNDPLDIWDPEEFYDNYGGSLYDWNQLYPRLITAIRQVDRDTPILVGGMGYSAVEWFPYLQITGDGRTVYTFHQYDPYLYTHQEPDSQECTYPGLCDTDWDGEKEQFDRAWLEDLLSTVDTFMSSHGAAVAVNEFGVMRWEPGAAEFMNDQMELFEERGINYAVWLWETSWPSYAADVDAFNFRHGPDPYNHNDIPSSTLMDIIYGHWGHNTIRPSNYQQPITAMPWLGLLLN